MKTTLHRHIYRAAKLAVLVSLPLSVSGCIVAMPPALQVASLALDGMSYLTTGKSVTDHAISTVANQDCAMMRPLKGEEICTDEAEQPQIALLPGGTTPAAPTITLASDAALAVTPAGEDAAFQSFANSPTATSHMDLDEILTAAEMEEFDMTTASGPAEEPAL